MLPRPPDPRDLFDFSGARELIDAGVRALDARSTSTNARSRRRGQPRRRPRPPTKRSCTSSGAASGCAAGPDHGRSVAGAARQLRRFGKDSGVHVSRAAAIAVVVVSPRAAVVGARGVRRRVPASQTAPVDHDSSFVGRVTAKHDAAVDFTVESVRTTPGTPPIAHVPEIGIDGRRWTTAGTTRSSSTTGSRYRVIVEWGTGQYRSSIHEARTVAATAARPTSTARRSTPPTSRGCTTRCSSSHSRRWSCWPCSRRSCGTGAGVRTVVSP